MAHVLPDGEGLRVGTLDLEPGALRVAIARRVGVRRAPAAGAPACPAPSAGAHAALELLFRQHQPFAQLRRDLLDEARDDAVARLAVEHAASRVREVEPAARPRDRDVHEAALLLDAAVLEHRVLVREETLLEPRDEDRGEFEPLRRVHRHELERILARGRFALARLQARMREERREDLLLGRARARDILLRFARGLEAMLEILGERRRRVDELVQVLEPVLPVLLGGVMFLEAARLQHFLDQLVQGERLRGLAQLVDRRDELRERRPAPAADDAGARAVHEAAQAAIGRVLQLLDRARADAARRKIHHAREGGVVVGIRGEAQVGERVLDFLALEEPQAAVDAVGDFGAEERVLEHARLGVRAVEQRHFRKRHALAMQCLHLVDDFNPVTLDDRVRQQLVRRLRRQPPCFICGARVDVELEVFPLPHVFDGGVAKRMERVGDGLSLRIEHGRLERYEHAGAH